MPLWAIHAFPEAAGCLQADGELVLARLMENMYFPIELSSAQRFWKTPCSQTKVIAGAAVADPKIDAMRRPSG
jgi:hypothetical protein